MRRIANWVEIAKGNAESMALDILEEGLRAADPFLSVREALSSLMGYIETFERIVVIGFGKASIGMALACEESLGDRISEGAIIAPKGSIAGEKPKRIEVLEGTHPIPSELNLRSAERLLSISKGLSNRDLVITLISGGGSALFTYPAPGITLEDKREATKLLLAAGATIQEINCIRKHISSVKGGQLVRHLHPARILGLILSDVVGDDVSSIASGPTSPDPSTYGDAWAILERCLLIDRIPRNVLKRIKMGLEGSIPDTPKPGDPIFEGVRNIIVANNMRALSAMAMRAKSHGLKAMIATSYLEGEAREVGKVMGSIAKQIRHRGQPLSPPCAILFGGETTVTLRGKGRGGRNQELALSVAISIAGLRDTWFASIGSDGVDGVTDAAGAIVSGTTFEEALRRGLDPIKYLDDNDSHTILKELGRLIYTGPTGTNVNDLAILLVLAGGTANPPASASPNSQRSDRATGLMGPFPLHEQEREDYIARATWDPNRKK
ncbi:MAG: glycerate kinase [Candidatus Bathyarchaeia archaeon]